jgi:hypothetical protein
MDDSIYMSYVSIATQMRIIKTVILSVIGCLLVSQPVRGDDYWDEEDDVHPDEKKTNDDVEWDEDDDIHPSEKVTKKANPANDEVEWDEDDDIHPSEKVTKAPSTEAETTDEEWELDDEDDADLTVGDDERPPEEDTSLAEAADASLTDTERKMRMALCFGIARQQFMENEEEMEKALEMIASLQNTDVTQAKELMHVNMIKNCYINFDQEKDIEIFANESVDKDAVKASMARLVAPSPKEEAGKQATLLQRQWDLLRDISKTEQERAQREFGKIDFIGSNMGGFGQLLYFVTVFGAIFGGGYMLVKKLLQTESERGVSRRKKDRRASKESREQSVAEERKKDQ